MSTMPHSIWATPLTRAKMPEITRIAARIHRSAIGVVLFLGLLERVLGLLAGLLDIGDGLVGLALGLEALGRR